MKKNQLESLIREHHEAAYYWALQLCKHQPDSAQDVLQMTYLKILENKARYNEQSSFKTWLFSVIRFTALDHFKNQRKFQALETVQLTTAIDPLAETPNLRPILDQLPERQKQVLLLAFYHDLTLAAIAEVLDISIGSVRTHYSRGKEALKQYLKPIRS